jgi:hypothetical protein
MYHIISYVCITVNAIHYTYMHTIPSGGQQWNGVHMPSEIFFLCSSQSIPFQCGIYHELAPWTGGGCLLASYDSYDS